jgi:hypothetical protein
MPDPSTATASTQRPGPLSKLTVSAAAAAGDWDEEDSAIDPL